MNPQPFSVIFLAGGMGNRMGASIPKQYLPLHQKPMALYSYEVLLSLPEVNEIVVVCDKSYQSLFENNQTSIRLSFAAPGIRRQDSVWSGIQQLKDEADLICVHDSARPLIKASFVRKVVQAAAEWGAATLAVPVKATIKMCDAAQSILSTPDRALLWEAQTPQVLKRALLLEGFKRINQQQLTVTDDVSIAELLGVKAKVVESSYENIKVTTPEDLLLIEHLLEDHVFV